MLNDHLILRGPVFWSQGSTTSSGPAVSANGLNLAPRLLPRRFQTTSRESTRISANRPISISVIEVPTPNSLILSCVPCIPWFQGSGAFLAGRGSWFVVSPDPIRADSRAFAGTKKAPRKLRDAFDKISVQRLRPRAGSARSGGPACSRRSWRSSRSASP